MKQIGTEFKDLKEVIKHLKSQVRLADLFMDYGFIENDGSQQMICIFHEGAGSTPSSRYYPDSDTYHCYVCHFNDDHGLDLVDFYCKYEEVPPVIAVAKIAEKFEVDLSEYRLKPEAAKNQRFYRNLARLKRRQEPPSIHRIIKTYGLAIQKFFCYPWNQGFRYYAVDVLSYYEEDAYDLETAKRNFEFLSLTFKGLSKTNADLEEWIAEETKARNNAKDD